MISENMFVGVEAEGLYKGRQTLFVPYGAATIQDVLTVLAQRTDIVCVYFGAGNCRGIVEGLLSNLYLLPASLIITVECDATTLHTIQEPSFSACRRRFRDFRVVFVIGSDADESAADAGVITDVKILGRHELVWCSFGRQDVTRYDDARYRTDRGVDL